MVEKREALGKGKGVGRKDVMKLAKARNSKLGRANEHTKHHLGKG